MKLFLTIALPPSLVLYATTIYFVVIDDLDAAWLASSLTSLWFIVALVITLAVMVRRQK